LSTLLSLKEETDVDGNKLTNIEIKALLLVSYLLSITPNTFAHLPFFQNQHLK